MSPAAWGDQPPEKWLITEDRVRSRNVYVAELPIAVAEIRLGEGQDFRLASAREVASGLLHSAALDEARPVAPVVRQLVACIVAGIDSADRTLSAPLRTLS